VAYAPKWSEKASEQIRSDIQSIEHKAAGCIDFYYSEAGEI